MPRLKGKDGDGEVDKVRICHIEHHYFHASNKFRGGMVV